MTFPNHNNSSILLGSPSNQDSFYQTNGLDLVSSQVTATTTTTTTTTTATIGREYRTICNPLPN